MKIETKSQIMAPGRHLPFEVVSLVLQGGGALGAYQAGVYEALSEADIHPNWIAGFPSEQSTPQSSPAIRLPHGSIGCGSFGHKSRPILDGPGSILDRRTPISCAIS